jgi:hypothetical protein
MEKEVLKVVLTIIIVLLVANGFTASAQTKAMNENLQPVESVDFFQEESIV